MNREPVGQAVNSIINALDAIIAMAKQPDTYAEVADEEAALGQVITRVQLVLSYIEERRQRPKLRVVQK